MISLGDHIVTTVAGMIGAGGHVDGTGSAARFSQFQGIAFDSSNSLLYVADTGSSTIRTITVPGYSVTTIAGRAYTIGSTDGATGIGTDAQFHDPCGITVDPAGTWIYVADTTNNTIRFIRGSSPWPVTTMAGAAGNAGNSDGVGPVARFDLPRGITTDGVFLIVSDASNDTIRKIEISTAATTTLAGRPHVSGSADGLGSAALFSSPCGIAEGQDWRSLRTCLYIADAGNNSIREALQ
jgi:DNA-binding beta-propeller fold protein YncE